ncbi:MAG: PhoH family protein [Rickettsiales endosymbiont of Dermacentor nuttalli]
MTTLISHHAIYISFDNNTLLSGLFSMYYSYLHHIEQKLQINISSACGNKLPISGTLLYIDQTKLVLEMLYAQLKQSKNLHTEDIDPTIDLAHLKHSNIPSLPTYIKTPKCVISTYSSNQLQYLHPSKYKKIVFASGPAGTEKTYLAIANAVHLFLNKQVKHIILSRSTVEAGEKISFLSGNIKNKIDPYLQPLYDVLLDMINADMYTKYIENGEIELAPLAFMCGCTLNKAYIILDEAQNTTTTQMKIFLTRLGKHSHMVITGDLSQVDLPNHIKPGLVDSIAKLSSLSEIGFIVLNEQDIIRGIP